MNQSTTALRLTVLAALALATTAQAAVVVYDNTAGSGDVIFFSPGSVLQTFTSPSYTSTLADLSLQLVKFGGSGGTMDYGLYTAAGALLANLGTVTDSTPGIPAWFSYGSLISLNLSSAPTLQANTQYAIGLTFNIPNDRNITAWAKHSDAGTGVAGQSEIVNSGDHGYLMMELSVVAAAVPEPAEYAAVTGLALGVFALVQRRRQATGR